MFGRCWDLAGFSYQRLARTRLVLPCGAAALLACLPAATFIAEATVSVCIYLHTCRMAWSHAVWLVLVFSFIHVLKPTHEVSASTWRGGAQYGHDTTLLDIIALA